MNGISSPALTYRDATRLAVILKALADPTRLRIVAQLADREMTVQEIQEAVGPLAQSTSSYHLQRLADAGVIVRTREPGVRTTNALNRAALRVVRELLDPGDVR